eukprot:g10893.t1
MWRFKDRSLNDISLEYSYEELKQATRNFDDAVKLGSGSYGGVFKGEGTEVAIKVLEVPNEAGFEEEVKVLSKFRHPNLVILMGFARFGPQRLLVYEMLAGGDVHRRLQRSSHQDVPFRWQDRVGVALDAACGLSHLHHSSPKVFHRDIKSPNILLDKNGTAKMADFGLACLSHSAAHRVQRASGTVGYACPLYVRRGVVTEGSEAGPGVYSFGMVLLELLTAQPPAYMSRRSRGGDGQIQDGGEGRVRGGVGFGRFRDGEARPSFADVVRALRALHEAPAEIPPETGQRCEARQVEDGARPFRPVSSSASRERSLRVWSLGAGGEEVRRGGRPRFVLKNCSGNGTRLNDQILQGRGDEAPLRHGDLVTLTRFGPAAGKSEVEFIQFRFDLSRSCLEGLELPGGSREAGVGAAEPGGPSGLRDSGVPSALHAPASAGSVGIAPANVASAAGTRESRRSSGHVAAKVERSDPALFLEVLGPGVKMQLPDEQRRLAFAPVMSGEEPFSSFLIGRAHQLDFWPEDRGRPTRAGRAPAGRAQHLVAAAPSGADLESRRRALLLCGEEPELLGLPKTVLDVGGRLGTSGPLLPGGSHEDCPGAFSLPRMRISSPRLPLRKTSRSKSRG